MSGKSIFFFLVGIILLAIFIWPSGTDYKIASVDSGNVFVLSNGTKVRLLGVTNTNQGKSELEKYIGFSVKLVPDMSAYFDVRKLTKKSTVNAYAVVKVGKGLCLNAALLKNRLASYVDNCHDSLSVYRSYANSRDGESIVVPEPEPEPEIDYEEDEIILPAPTPHGERKHSAWYTDGNMNLEMLEEACDFNLPYTKAFANDLAGRCPGNFNMGQVCEIFGYCYNKWRYVNDPADSEYVARASESIAASLSGDCDDFAVLIASCILSIGGRPCINTGHNPSGGHAFTEVDISMFNENEVLKTIQKYFPEYPIDQLFYRTDNGHKWLNLDWQCAYPGGKYYDCSSSWDAYPYINGSWTWKHIH